MSNERSRLVKDEEALVVLAEMGDVLHSAVVNKGWRAAIVGTTHLRLSTIDESGNEVVCCPLTAFVYVRTEKFFPKADYIQASSYIGIGEEIAKAICRASDNVIGHEKSLRAFLLERCGLEQKP